MLSVYLQLIHYVCQRQMHCNILFYVSRSEVSNRYNISWFDVVRNECKKFYSFAVFV